MTDTGNNPFGEPDFSGIQSSGADEAEDEEFTDEDDELGDDELDEEEDDQAGGGEVTAGADDFDQADDVVVEAASAGEGDAGNRVAGGTARSVLEHVARSIVDDPEGVTVDVAESRGGVRLSLHVAQGDMGRIIGRRGRTAQALRTLVRAAAARDGQEASVDIVD
jgi:predicted RNA-binding protein YlqC (UPF0109 family)